MFLHVRTLLHHQLYNSADIINILLYLGQIINVFQMYFAIIQLLSHVGTLIISACKNMINCNRRLYHF